MCCHDSAIRRQRKPPAGNTQCVMGREALVENGELARLVVGGALCKRYGTNIYRKRLLQGLKLGLDNLRDAGCRRVFLDGSFVTSKYRPNDFDACWKAEDVDLEKLDPIIQCYTNGRRAQKAKYRGEFLPTQDLDGDKDPILDFFQRDREGNTKGIVLIDMGEYDD